MEYLKQKPILVITLIVVIQLFIFRGTFPLFKNFFFIILSCFLFYYFSFYQNKQENNSFSVKKNLLIFITIFIQIFAFFTSNKVYLLVLKDVVNVLVLLFLLMFLFKLVSTIRDLNHFYKYFLSIITLCAIIISLFQYSSFVLGSFYDSKVIDSNFIQIPILFGFIVIFYLNSFSISAKLIIFYNILLYTFTFIVLLSGSRRALFIYAIIIFVIVLMVVFKAYIKYKIKLLNFVPFLITFIITFLMIYLFVFNTSFNFKNKTIDYFTSQSKIEVKSNIAQRFYRVLFYLNPKLKYDDFYHLLWSYGFDSSDPDTGWGKGVHKTIFPLTGKNVDIVPPNAKGFRLDSASNITFIKENNWWETATQLHVIKSVKGVRCKFKIYAFVSDDFNGNVVRLSLPSEYIAKNIVIGNGAVAYDLDAKGIWKELEVDFISFIDEIPIYISIIKFGSIENSELRGHVIFAYPTYETYKVPIDKELNIVKLSIVSGVSVISNSLVCNIFNEEHVRKKIKDFVSDDTTYYQFNTKLRISYSQDKFGDDRINRWKFALEIWSKEYNWAEKIFGGGFDFLNWYGKVFLNDKTKSDYPHNPFLHILLYSGIVGVILYCILLTRVVQLYWKYRKDYPLFGIFFLITYYFTFFSGGNPFDPPVMGFFMLLPFLIEAVHKKENKKQIDFSTDV